MSVTLDAGQLTEIVRLPSPYGNFGSVILCGIPKTEDGRFYCPSCDFVSDDIENFATSMCWDCVFNDEEGTDGNQE